MKGYLIPFKYAAFVYGLVWLSGIFVDFNPADNTWKH